MESLKKVTEDFLIDRTEVKHGLKIYDKNHIAKVSIGSFYKVPRQTT